MGLVVGTLLLLLLLLPWSRLPPSIEYWEDFSWLELLLGFVLALKVNKLGH